MMNSYKLPFQFDSEMLIADLEQVRTVEWIAHYNQGDYEGGWSVAPLRAVQGSSTNIYATPMPDIYQNTTLLARCPYFRHILATFNCQQTSVRLMKLDPGSEIKEHADSSLSYKNQDVRLHVPVVTNAEVDFFLNGERIEMKVGECWYLDFTQLHRVCNRSQTPRIHLVIDCLVNDWLREIFEAGGMISC